MQVGGITPVETVAPQPATGIIFYYRDYPNRKILIYIKIVAGCKVHNLTYGNI